MPQYRRIRVPGGTYFFTVNLADRSQSLLTEHVAMLRDVMAAVRTTRPFHIDAAVILPEHLHAVWTLPPGDVDYSMRWSRIKSEFSRRVCSSSPCSTSRVRRRERGLWQRRFWEHTIRDEDDFNHHVDYIHFNPVKHGLVSRPVDGPHSSIHQYIRRGILTADWGTLDVPSDHDWQ
jgi:putative transposase